MTVTTGSQPHNTVAAFCEDQYICQRERDRDCIARAKALMHVFGYVDQWWKTWCRVDLRVSQRWGSTRDWSWLSSWLSSTMRHKEARFWARRHEVGRLVQCYNHVISQNRYIEMRCWLACMMVDLLYFMVSKQPSLTKIHTLHGRRKVLFLQGRFGCLYYDCANCGGLLNVPKHSCINAVACLCIT